MKKFNLHWQIAIAFILAVFFGLFLTDYVVYVKWMGEIFLRGLNMIIVPLILTSIISGVVSIGSGGNLGRLGFKTAVYYITTSLFAIVTGLILVNIFKPGVGIDLGLRQDLQSLPGTQKSFGEILISIIPTNIFSAFSEGQTISIIFFAILFGFFITKIDSKYKENLQNFFEGASEVIMKITIFIMKFAPIGIFGIIAKTVAEQAGDLNNLLNIVGRLGIYMLVVISGLVIHSTVTLPALLKFAGRVSPVKHLKVMSTPLVTAFSTSSSNATLPLTIDAVEHKAGVSNKIASFTLPLGATINMDGTALYECVAAMFIAQAYGIEMHFAQQFIIVFTALLASIGAAGVPMAGLVMMSIVLTSVGLPLEGIGLILAVDRLLDMFRTTVNVFSDSCGAVIIAKTEKENLKV